MDIIAIKLPSVIIKYPIPHQLKVVLPAVDSYDKD